MRKCVYVNAFWVNQMKLLAVHHHTLVREIAWYKKGREGKRHMLLCLPLRGH